MFDYYGRGSLVSLLESEISLDSDPWNSHLSRWIGTACCFGFNHVRFERCVIDYRGKDYGATDAVKGDLFVILGACCYGVSNVLEEYLVSKRPMYEVVGEVTPSSFASQS